MEIEDLLAQMKLRLADAEADAESLQRAIAALEGETKSESAPERRRGRRNGSAGSSTKPVPTGKIMAAVAEHQGITTTQLAKQLEGVQSQILARLKEAEAEGTVRREGERRGTKWFAVTDDDRVAERVAQLEAV